MGVFHVFKIAQIVTNRATHQIYRCNIRWDSDLVLHFVLSIETYILLNSFPSAASIHLSFTAHERDVNAKWIAE